MEIHWVSLYSLCEQFHVNQCMVHTRSFSSQYGKSAILKFYQRFFLGFLLNGVLGKYSKIFENIGI